MNQDIYYVQIRRKSYGFRNIKMFYNLGQIMYQTLAIR